MNDHKIINARGCWEWTGATDKKMGYGKMTYVFPGTAREYKVHRIAAHIYKGFPLDSELQVCHKCDNPRCFNPDHLFFGTAKDNMRDASQKGRLRFFRNRGVKISKEQALEIRALIVEGKMKNGAIAGKFNVSESLIRAIGKGKAWGYANV